MRIRTVKPEFWSSLTIASLSRDTRLTFIGLWNYVDDDGRGVYEPRLLKSALWPLDDDITPSVIHNEHIAELEAAGLIGRYVVEGIVYLSVTGWREHQAISKPRPSKLPEPSGIPPVDLLAGKEGKGKEQGKEGNLKAAAPIVDNNPNQPTNDQVYLAERLDMTIPSVVKLNKRFGRGLVADSMRLLHGFPPEDGTENPVAYLTTMCQLKEANVG